MSGERLLASYIVRVVVRDGARSINLHVVGTGETWNFTSYIEMIEHFELREEQLDSESQGGSR